jgi:hypothetical protein
MGSEHSSLGIQHRLKTQGGDDPGCYVEAIAHDKEKNEAISVYDEIDVIAVAAAVLWLGSTDIFVLGKKIIALVVDIVPLVIEAQTTGTVYLAIEDVHFAVYVFHANAAEDEQWLRLDYGPATGAASSMNVVSSTTGGYVTLTNERHVRDSRTHLSRLGPTKRSRDSIENLPAASTRATTSLATTAATSARTCASSSACSTSSRR